MDDIERKKRPGFRDDDSYIIRRRLWCGRIQELCDGSLCSRCHLFPDTCTENESLLSTPTLTDCDRIGLTAEDEE